MNLFRGKTANRKLHQLGEYSYALVLPKDWLLQHGNPSEVEIRVKRDRIMVTPLKPKGS